MKQNRAVNERIARNLRIANRNLTVTFWLLGIAGGAELLVIATLVLRHWGAAS